LHEVTKKHYGEELHGVRWALVSEDDTIQVKEMEEKGMRLWSSAFVGCAHCGSMKDPNDMMQHLQQV
jgi:hypothetical protein